MKTLILIPFLAFVLVSCNSCTQSTGPQDPVLPPLTQEGKNILACKVNGKVIIASGRPLMSDPTGVSFTLYNTGELSIGGGESKPRFGIGMRVEYKDTQSLYQLGKWPNRATFTDGFSEVISNSKGHYQTDSLRTGLLHITYYDKKILAGTFEFDAVSEDGSVIHITEGRFDIKVNENTFH